MARTQTKMNMLTYTGLLLLYGIPCSEKLNCGAVAAVSACVMRSAFELEILQACAMHSASVINPFF